MLVGMDTTSWVIVWGLLFLGGVLLGYVMAAFSTRGRR
jgi:cbb3-type cytochrome oxidase subunit 3